MPNTDQLNRPEQYTDTRALSWANRSRRPDYSRRRIVAALGVITLGVLAHDIYSLVDNASPSAHAQTSIERATPSVAHSTPARKERIDLTFLPSSVNAGNWGASEAISQIEGQPGNNAYIQTLDNKLQAIEDNPASVPGVSVVEPTTVMASQVGSGEQINGLPVSVTPQYQDRSSFSADGVKISFPEQHDSPNK